MQNIPLPVDDPNAPITLRTEDAAECNDPSPRDPPAHPSLKVRPVFARTIMARAYVETQEDEPS